MGGQAVSVVASQLNLPLAVIPGLSPSSVSQLFAFGHMSVVCDWSALSAGLKVNGDHKALEYQARTKMAELMSVGDIVNYPVPYKAKCSIINARNDTYIPLDLTQNYLDHWPHAKVKLINGGHISSILFQQQQMNKEIIKAVNRL
jgi:hypothetical protein